MELFSGGGGENLEVMPLVVIAQTFPARPSSIPDIRDFVRRVLAQSPLPEEDSRSVTRAVSEALLEAAGPTGTIQVSFRIFPDHAEVDVLRSHPRLDKDPNLETVSSFLPSDGARPGPVGPAGPVNTVAGSPNSSGPTNYPGGTDPGGVDQDAVPDTIGEHSESFADWMAGALRRQGMTMEAAARQLGVSVKTVSRWVGGTTEPRLRDLRRIQEIFGDLPFR